jgi:tubulin polyglutamylase TTLL2
MYITLFCCFQVQKVDNCFELYGFDILVDESMKPWLLEVNFSPSLSVDCQADVLAKKPMLHDLMDLLHFQVSAYNLDPMTCD